MRQLAKKHGHKLLPTAEPLGVALGLMVLEAALQRVEELQRIAADTSASNCP
jgi:hypothetical protein